MLVKIYRSKHYFDFFLEAYMCCLFIKDCSLDMIDFIPLFLKAFKLYMLNYQNFIYINQITKSKMEKENQCDRKSQNEQGKVLEGLEGLDIMAFIRKYVTDVYTQEDMMVINPKQSKLMRKKAVSTVPTIRSDSASMENFQILLKNNAEWAAETLKKNPQFFANIKDTQNPTFLWIGCADSRVPPNQIVQMSAGQIFVHRNIANQAPLSDVNALATIQFSVQVLKVKDIIVCGHYGCGGVKAAFKKHDHGPLEAWLSLIRDLRAKYRHELTHSNAQQNQDALVELNVKQQVHNISRVPIVQKVWKQGGQLRIHGVVYQLKDGTLKDLGLTLDSAETLPEQYKLY